MTELVIVLTFTLPLAIAIRSCVRPNPSLNADVPHVWAALTSGPPVSLIR